MPLYEVIQDINSGKNPIGSTIEFSEEQAAAISHAVKLLDDAPVEPPAGNPPAGPMDDPEEVAFAKHVAETSIAKLVGEVVDIEDPDTRMDRAIEIMAIEAGSEKPRKGLMEKLQEVVAQAQDGTGSGEEGDGEGE